MPQFSVIIPALDEAENLPACIASVQAAAGTQPEIIVADGGSRDATRTLAAAAGATVVQAPRGRGRQCNAGVAAAGGEILLFLHADTRLPPNAFQVLAQVFSNPAVQAGSFRLRFDPSHWILRLYEPFARFDSPFTRFGDQCLTLRRDFFRHLGGFPDWPLFEDVGLLQAARRQTRIVSFPAVVTTSARRYHENGVVRQQGANLWLMLQYLAGRSPEALAASYDRRDGRTQEQAGGPRR